MQNFWNDSVSGSGFLRVLLTIHGFRHALLQSSVSLAVLAGVGLVGVSSGAQASCSGLNTTTVSCTGTNTGAVTSAFDGDNTATLTDWQITNGRFFLHTVTPIANVTQTLNASGVTGYDNVGDTNGVLHVAAKGLNSNAIAIVENSTLTQASIGHGIGAHGDNATGYATITATNVTINILAAATGTSVGVLATTNGTGTATVTFTGGSVTAANTNPAVLATSASGDVFTTVRGGTITTTGNTSAGVAATVRSGAGNATLTNGDIVLTSGTNSAGVMASTVTGSISLSNSGALTTQGGSSSGISATVSGAGGGITLGNTGTIITAGSTAYGITATTSTGAINLNNSGSITTSGSSASGIYTTATNGAMTLTNSGVINTSGNTASGIYSTSSGTGSIRIDNTGAITANGLTTSMGLRAVASGSGNATITSTGANVTTNGTGVDNHGISASAKNGDSRVEFSNGIVSVAGQSAALAAFNHGTSLASTATVIITNHGIVDATRSFNQGSVHAYATNSGAITIDATSEVHGGWDKPSVGAWWSIYRNIAVGLGGYTQTLNNAGIIDAMSDSAVGGDLLKAGTFTLNNTGTITGSVRAISSTSTFNNDGVWNLRNFADTNGDGVRDRLAVAVSDLGSSGTNVINNTGTVALLGHGTDPVTTLDTTGMYLPNGYSFNTMAANSPVQGQIFGVQTFNNSGIIDLTANASAGDVLVISGGHTAGTNGGGVFVANGGTLRLNTVLNEGGANSQSDILVVDSTRLGTAATGIAISPVGASAGALTTGNGILLVEVLNKPASADGVFALSSRVTAGAYEYYLFHNGVGNDADDGNWYLRNVFVPLPEPPGCETTNTCNPVVPVPIVRPEVPVSMVIPPLAIEYGYAMLDTLHERVGETYLHNSGPATEERIVWCKDASRNFKCVVRVPVANANGAGKDETRWASSGWARLLGDRGLHQPDNFARRGPNYDYTFGGIQASLDIYAREQADGTLDKVGIYVGYGQIASNVKGQLGGKAGNVDMDAYTLAGYWTHHSPQGWYTDAVVQGTWYSADAKSVYGTSLKPDGFGILGSLEGGYSFKLGSGWTLEPQAQIVYQNVSFDHTHLSDAFVRFDDGESLRGRLGLRLTKTWNTADQGKEPRLITAWLRANVWHEFLGKTKTSWGSVDGQNMTPFNSYLGGTWGEIGAGVTAQMSDKINIFATGAYNRSLDNKGREGWDGRLGMTVKW